MGDGGTIKVRVELLDVEEGHWCTACRLSTGERVYVVTSYGPWAHLEVVLWCDGCESGEFVVVEDVGPER